MKFPKFLTFIFCFISIISVLTFSCFAEVVHSSTSISGTPESSDIPMLVLTSWDVAASEGNSLDRINIVNRTIDGEPLYMPYVSSVYGQQPYIFIDVKKSLFGESGVFASNGLRYSYAVILYSDDSSNLSSLQLYYNWFYPGTNHGNLVSADISSSVNSNIFSHSDVDNNADLKAMLIPLLNPVSYKPSPSEGTDGYYFMISPYAGKDSFNSTFRFYGLYLFTSSSDAFSFFSQSEPNDFFSGYNQYYNDGYNDSQAERLKELLYGLYASAEFTYTFYVNSGTGDISWKRFTGKMSSLYDSASQSFILPSVGTSYPSAITRITLEIEITQPAVSNLAFSIYNPFVIFDSTGTYGYRYISQMKKSASYPSASSVSFYSVGSYGVRFGYPDNSTQTYNYISLTPDFGSVDANVEAMNTLRILPSAAVALSSSSYYDSGFKDGLLYAENEYYQKLEAEKDKAHNAGYTEGYNAGLNDTNEYTFKSLFTSLFQSGYDVFYDILNFEILGINVLGFVTGLITLLVAAFVIKKLL